MNDSNNGNVMTYTKRHVMMFGIIAAAIFTIGLTMTQVEAEEKALEPRQSMRMNDPFSFNVPTDETLRTSYTDVNRSTPIADLSKDSVITLPIQIDSISKETATIKFHATYGGQIDKPIMPAGIDAKIVPSTITLKSGESQIINLVVTSSENTKDTTYLMNIVGWYGDTANDFKGTAVKINVGQSDGRFTLSPGATQ